MKHCPYLTILCNPPSLPNIIGNLSKDVFERRTSTGSEVFSLLICLDANKFVLLSFSSLIKTIYPRFSTEPLPNDAKSPLPVDVRRSKTLLLKLPIKQRRRQRQGERQKKKKFWLAQFGERRSAERDVTGSNPGRTNIQGLKITERKVLPL